jgi:hypothetical protein
MRSRSPTMNLRRVLSPTSGTSLEIVSKSCKAWCVLPVSPRETSEDGCILLWSKDLQAKLGVSTKYNITCVCRLPYTSTGCPQALWNQQGAETPCNTTDILLPPIRALSADCGLSGPEACGPRKNRQTCTVSISRAIWERMRWSECKLHGCIQVT